MVNSISGDSQEERKRGNGRKGVGKETYIRVGKDEFAKRGIECVSVHTVSCCEDQVRRGSVPIMDLDSVSCECRRDEVRCSGG